jgi:pimeloyl-ACP methyl ester carboxylesterase
MAHRSFRRLPALLIVLSLSACAAGASQGPTPVNDETTTTSASSSTTTTSTTKTSTTASTTTTTVAPTTTASDAGQTTAGSGSTASSAGPGTTTTTLAGPAIEADVGVPDGEGPFPTVVLVHGGGWIVGDPSLMGPLATHLTGNGFLTVNTEYQLATFDRPGFPTAVDDVACAVRYAATHPDSDGTVAVVGHSAGAHIGALVALTGDDYGSDCPHPGDGVPERFVGLAGPYDVSRLGPVVAPFFGAGPDNIPEAWEAGNPQLQANENPSLDSLIMYGQLDGFVADSFAFDFFAALESSGSSALLELVEGARHMDMDDPDFVGDLIVTWLER